MQLVEQHLIRKTDPCYASLDAAAFASKNLYNQATYQIRQAFMHEGKYLPYAEIFRRIKHMDCYQALPRKVSNSILILIHENWVAFFKALKAYKAEQLAALTSSKPGFIPRLINGRPLKDFNHYYNQQRARHQERLAKQSRRTSHQLDRITAKRTRRVNHYLH